MEFLPIQINGRKVYAGFWKRFFAGFVDMLVFLPFMFLFHFMDGISIAAAMICAVLSGLLYSVYSIGFHYKFGATLGKMAAGIKVTRPNGEDIGLKHAFLRSSFDLIFAVASIYTQLIVISQVDPAIYLIAGWMEQAQYSAQFYPSWFELLNIATCVWVLSEFVVLLFNKRKRALHDFIAGTVVVHKTMLTRATSSNVDSALPVS
jgi:uncharacterized RDD family membrane protein YckC